MEHIFYSFGIIYLIYQLWVVIYNPTTKEKKVDENDTFEMIQWVKEHPRIWIPTLIKWIWFPIGLFTHLWSLFLLLILLEFLYHKIYDWSRATKYNYHKLFWYTHHIVELIILISILIIHFKVI